MAGWITQIIGGLLGNATDIIDEVITTKEEKEELKIKMKDLIVSSEVELEKGITQRWKADMKSDSWLSKNVRPMVLIFLVTSTVLLVFIDAGRIGFTVQDKWVDLLQLVLITVLGAYFGGRPFEKIKK